ncbi:MAG: hypothetical protein WD066_04935 [Planctomycetaceae bacterium]
MVKIIEQLGHEARPLFEAALATGRSPLEIAAAEIEGIDADGGALILPAASVSGRAIRKRELLLDAELDRIVRTASGERTAGRIFLNSRGEPWSAERLSQVFRSARMKAGISADVVMAGRGGGRASERK